MKQLGTYSSALLMMLLCSCGVSKMQVDMVQNLALKSDTITHSPVQIFVNMQQVNRERGLYYAASLSSPSLHVNELESMVKTDAQNITAQNKAQTYVLALNSYCRALRNLSSETRWKQIGTELRGLGNKTDSVILYLNKSDWMDKTVPEGYARLSGRYSGWIAQRYMKVRQKKALVQFVTESDTLVSVCTEALIEVLKSPELDALLANEREGLKDNYTAYLQYLERSGAVNLIENDKLFIDLYSKSANAEKIRTNCVSALRYFAKAHHNLALRLLGDGSKKNKRKDRIEQLKDIADDLATLSLYTKQLIELID